MRLIFGNYFEISNIAHIRHADSLIYMQIYIDFNGALHVIVLLVPHTDNYGRSI